MMQYKQDKTWKNWSDLWRKQIYEICNDCQDMLQDVDEIISQPFPVNCVFHESLTNIEAGFILQPFFLSIIE